MRHIVTCCAANGTLRTITVDARTEEGACSRAARKLNRVEPLDAQGKRHAWMPVGTNVWAR